MAGELSIQIATTGKTVVATVDGLDRTTTWNGSAFVAKSSLSDAQRAAASTACAEQASSDPTNLADYVATWPAITAAGLYLVKFWDTTPAPDNYIGFQLYDPSRNAVVSGFTAAALLELIQTDTGETTASAGSVGKIAQGAAGGNVTVEAFTAPAIAALIAGGILAKTTEIDGLSIENLTTTITGVLGGKSAFDKATRTVTFYARDGSTVVATLVLGTDPGNRTSSTILGE